MENSRLPFCPKLILTVSIALLRTLPPIRPARNSKKQPMTWPTRIAERPRARPIEAK